jgi:hypothetical protein
MRGQWRQLVGVIVVSLATIGWMTACGGSNSTSSKAAGGDTGTGTTQSTPTATPRGCGQYCEQAGVSQGGGGNEIPGYRCPPDGGNVCLPCPAAHCMSVLDSSASASGGAFAVRLRCNLSSSLCEGALLLCQVNHACHGDSQPGNDGFHGRIAASDFVVQAGRVAEVPIGLTTSGAQLLNQARMLSGWVIVDLKDYGFSQTANAPPIFDERNGVPTPASGSNAVGDQPWLTLNG